MELRLCDQCGRSKETKAFGEWAYCRECLVLSDEARQRAEDSLGQQVESDLSELGPSEFAHLSFCDDVVAVADQLDSIPPVVIFPRSPEKGGSLAAAVDDKKFSLQLQIVGQETVKAIAYATQLAAVGWRREAQKSDIDKAVGCESNARSLDRGMDLINQVHQTIVSDVRFGLQNSAKSGIRAVKP